METAMTETAVADNGEPKGATRSQRFRKRMRNEGCTRLDLTVGTDVADRLRAVAKKRGVPLWQAAEEAFEGLAAAHGL